MAQPSFADHSSVIAFNQRNDELTRELQVAIEYKGIIRERLSKCVKTEGVNNYVNCQELREQYYALCTDRFHGMKFPADSPEFNRGLPGVVNK